MEKVPNEVDSAEKWKDTVERIEEQIQAFLEGSVAARTYNELLDIIDDDPSLTNTLLSHPDVEFFEKLRTMKTIYEKK